MAFAARVIHRPCQCVRPAFPQRRERNSLTGKPFLAVIAGSPGPCGKPAIGPAQAPRNAAAVGIHPRKLPRWTIMKRTYQASKVRRARTHGFLVRKKTRGGRAVINARRAKGRKRLAV